MAEAYELWKAMSVAGEDITFWQNIYVKFYQAFIEADRWKQYLEGMATTLYVTVIAILIGIVLGVIVASIRTAHDQQRRKKNIVLGFFNAICKIYVTVIRGTPMMVQLMILGFVVFKSSRNFTMVGALGLGLNSGAYVAEIIRGGLMSLDQGQSEAGRSLGLGYMDTMRFIVVPQASRLCCRPGQRVYHTPEGHLAAHDNRRQGAGTCCTGDNEPDLGADVPASGHILPVSGHGPDTQLAAGQAGKEAASK